MSNVWGTRTATLIRVHLDEPEWDGLNWSPSPCCIHPYPVAEAAIELRLRGLPDGEAKCRISEQFWLPL